MTEQNMIRWEQGEDGIVLLTRNGSVRGSRSSE